MEISLTNVSVSYERMTSTQFSELLLCLQFFFFNNQSKRILYQRDIFSGTKFCSPTLSIHLYVFILRQCQHGTADSNALVKKMCHGAGIHQPGANLQVCFKNKVIMVDSVSPLPRSTLPG